MTNIPFIRKTKPMLQSLYKFYLHSPLNLYDIRKHFLEHFYYQYHSKKEARGVLTTVIDSSKINALIEESLNKKKALTCDDFAHAVNSILKLMLKPRETQALAVIDTALRWDIEVNSLLKLRTPEELKKDTIRVFGMYSVWGEVPKEESGTTNSNTSEGLEIKQEVSINTEEIQEDCASYRKASKLKTWSLSSFTEQFGKMQIAAFTNRMTGEIFVSCVCMKGRKKTYVAFSSKLGELTPEEIEEMKEDLVVVQLPSGRYCLAKPKNGMWKDVDI